MYHTCGLCIELAFEVQRREVCSIPKPRLLLYDHDVSVSLDIFYVITQIINERTSHLNRNPLDIFPDGVDSCSR